MRTASALSEELAHMRPHSAHALTALMIVAAVAPACAAEVTEAELMQAAVDLAHRYDSNYNAKDPAAMAALYATDGTLLSPAGPAVRGRDALKAYYTDRFAAGANGHATKVLEVHVQGDGGYGINQFSVNSPQANGGGLHEVSGRIVTIYQRDPDGWHMRLVDPTVSPGPPKN
jgi:uncharacterized protein (TIGR02246 family)